MERNEITEKEKRDAEWLKKYRESCKKMYSDPNFKPSGRYGYSYSRKKL